MPHREGPAAALDGLAEVWGSMVALGRALPAGSFGLPTDCPGWTVKDQFSHVIGTELLLEGEPAPDPGPRPAHVRNDLGDLNERFVEARRSKSGHEVVEELAALASRRLSTLGALDDEAWSVIGPSPVGMVAFADYMGLRAFDCFVHEQDVRTATDVPGGRNGYGERVTLDRMEALVPYVFGRRVAPPAGTTLRVEVTGPLAREIQLGMVEQPDGALRAVPMPVLASPPTAVLRLDQEGFVRRACGRASADATLRRRTTQLEGDRALAARVVEELAVVP